MRPRRPASTLHITFCLNVDTDPDVSPGMGIHVLEEGGEIKSRSRLRNERIVKPPPARNVHTWSLSRPGPQKLILIMRFVVCERRNEYAPVPFLATPKPCHYKAVRFIGLW